MNKNRETNTRQIQGLISVLGKSRFFHWGFAIWGLLNIIRAFPVSAWVRWGQKTQINSWIQTLYTQSNMFIYIYTHMFYSEIYVVQQACWVDDNCTQKKHCWNCTCVTRHGLSVSLWFHWRLRSQPFVTWTTCKREKSAQCMFTCNLRDRYQGSFKTGVYTLHIESGHRPLGPHWTLCIHVCV